jgi:hypothetical protein
MQKIRLLGGSDAGTSSRGQGNNPVRILVLEDNETARFVFRAVLEPVGYAIVDVTMKLRLYIYSSAPMNVSISSSRTSC